MIAIEIDGGTWINGAHSRGSGVTRDCEKQNAAMTLGWRFLRYTTDMIKNQPGQIIKDIEAL